MLQSIIKKFTMEDSLYYNDEKVLHYKIVYPQFYSDKYTNQLEEINNFYRREAIEQMNKIKSLYYNQAVENMIYAKKNQFPIAPFEVYYIPTLTYNEDCVISLYYDNYVFSGGAHGTTVRTSETWEIKTAKKENIDKFFKKGVNINLYLVNFITSEIENSLKTDIFIYFENYDENVANTLNLNNFYIKNDGIVIYFQQYDIAPYSSGIPEFLVPFSNEYTIKPHCKDL